MYDELTGLYNRQTFFELLKHIIYYAEKACVSFGLLIIDIRSFRKINMNYGHQAGDEVLKALAGVLKSVCREGDYVTRIGDDQFAMVLPRISNVGHVKLAALKIQRLMEIPVKFPDREIVCNTVIGISLYPSNGSDMVTLLQAAEIALDKAKEEGNSIGLSEQEQNLIVSGQREMELSLENAIKHSELRVYFQPKISLATGKPVGAEALVRWNHAAFGVVSPDEFLPVAEIIGFIKPLTLWMLNSALRMSSAWTDKWGRLEVSVNIPPSILEQADFVDVVMSAENLWQRDNVDLCLEILEKSLASDVNEVFKKLNTLREHGIKIAIDDFGTGYSSLAYFRDIPTDELKIDKSFVRGLKQDKANVHIVSLIIDLAHRFGLKVIAEGVEDGDVLRYLKKKGCDQVQGYYFGKPMPSDTFVEWLEQYQPEKEFLQHTVKA